MEENYKIEELQNSINNLKEEFDKLIISNPFLLFLTRKNTEDKKIYGKFIIYTIIFYVVAIAIGFGLAFVILNNSEQPNITPITYLIISALISILVINLRQVSKEETFQTRISPYIVVVLIIITALLSYFFDKDDTTSKLIFNIVPYVSFGIFIIAYIFVFFPLTSRMLRKSIKNRVQELQTQISEVHSVTNEIIDKKNDEIYQIFKNDIIQRYDEIAKKISSIEQSINIKESDNHTERFNMLTSSILESLKLELVQSARHGINLVKNWEYIELSLNMINEIKENNDLIDNITIVGDLSLLSSKGGLRMLFDTIQKTDKSFNIYFTGKKPGKKTIIKSSHFSQLVENFEEIKHEYTEMESILEKIEFVPISSNVFTGLGFIGFAAKNGNGFNKVYAFISSLLIPHSEECDIVKSNPFVFSWVNNTNYFKEFVDSKLTGNLKIEVKNQVKKPMEFLEI